MDAIRPDADLADVGDRPDGALADIRHILAGLVVVGMEAVVAPFIFPHVLGQDMRRQQRHVDPHAAVLLQMIEEQRPIIEDARLVERIETNRQVVHAGIFK